MQYAVKEFAESKEHGLCLVTMPTGTGKTFQTKKFLEKYLNGEFSNDIELLVYITPLKKNIDDIYKELKSCFRNNPELFDKNVLRLYSNSECVVDHFLEVDNQIQSSLKKKESYKQLKDRIIAYNKLKETGGVSNDVCSALLQEIRKSIEPCFRRDIENEIARDAKTESLKIKKINHDFVWVKTLYPACLTKGKKILFMTMDKFLLGNDPIVSKPYRFISHSKINKSLIFIDEFDATKDVVLNEAIEKCLDYRINIAKLFCGITSSLKNVQVPENLFGGSNDENDPKSCKSAFLRMKKKFLEIEEQYHLNYLFKLSNAEDFDRYFLFDNYQLHTVTSTDKSGKIKVKNDKNLNQNIITIGNESDDGTFYRAIYGMKSALKYFIDCCSAISKNYLQFKNKEARERNQDIMEISQAISTVIDYFNLDRDISKTLSSLIEDEVSIPSGTRKREMLSSDFYMNGFRYFDFNDDISHDMSTTIYMCYLDNTPERFILSLANKAKVVGLSATGDIKSVTGNYDLQYITNKLQDMYYEFPDDDKNRIEKDVKKKIEAKYPINVTNIYFEDVTPSYIARKIFEEDDYVEKYKSKFEFYAIPNSKKPYYEINRVGKVILSIKEFLKNNKSKVILVLTNKNIKTNYEKDPFNKDFISEIINDLCDVLKISKKPSIFCLFGNDFEKEKQSYYADVKKGEKVILFSSYPAVGTGQNLQYESEENSGEEELKKEKDIDAIYVEEPTNIIVHRDSIKDERDLAKFIYQMEALRSNYEISPYKANQYIKSAFKKYISPSSYVNFDREVYQCNSTNNHKIKILIQAIGRICRTSSKKKTSEVNIFVDDEILQNVNFNGLKGKLLNPEFDAVIEKSRFKSTTDTKTKILLNKAMNSNAILEAKINNLLSVNKDKWSDEDMNQWNKMREVVLKYPTISRLKLDEVIKETGCEFLKDFYLFEKPGKKLFQYSYYTGDENQENSKIWFGVKNESDWTLINKENSRLSVLMSDYSVRQYFIDHKYATSFEPNEGIILPVIYQNIYKGALGEVAGRVILERYGIKLKEITDPFKFEKFDFCLEADPDIYIDFKNWSENHKKEKEKDLTKCVSKLEKIHGKKVYVINMYASEFVSKREGNVITITSLFEQTNQPNHPYKTIVYELNKVLSKMLGDN